MKNVTYLFGAGASVGALPIVNELPSRLESFIKDIKSYIEYPFRSDEPYTAITFNSPKTFDEINQEFLKAVQWLKEGCINHASIDTFAKKLWLKKNYKDLTKLKCLLSIFFILEQAKPIQKEELIKYSLDERYDSFFASILNSLSHLPTNINILSWNYDYQFEKAFSQYIDIDSIEKIRVELNVDFLNESSWPPSNKKFSILKLNGSTLPYILDGNSNSINLKEIISTSYFKKSVSIYASFIRLCETTFGLNWQRTSLLYPLSFAWENREIIPGKSGEMVHIKELAKYIAIDTEVLVIVGYSFPFFNREIDREIIGAMSKLEKVYFQAPDAQNLKERFRSITEKISSDNLIPIFDIKQFYLPNEL
jgi:hypothetical protein